jgi:osmoprotectant transport system ATP-binding protein
MLTSTQGGAVVTGDDDRYLGVVSFGQVVDHLRVVQAEAVERAPEVTASSEPEDHHDPDAPMDDSREPSDA